MRLRKRGGEPKRKVSDKAKRRSVLVFTEGKKTEPVYLMHWSRAYRERIIVTIDGFHGTPLSLVQEAANRRAADLKAARRGGGDAYSDLVPSSTSTSIPTLPGRWNWPLSPVSWCASPTHAWNSGSCCTFRPNAAIPRPTPSGKLRRTLTTAEFHERLAHCHV